MLLFQVFKSKTGNSWSDRANFNKVPKKYVLVKSERSQFVTPEILKPLLKTRLTLDKKSSILETKVPSTLSPCLRKTLHYLTDVDMLASAVRQSGLDMPLGRLDKLVLTDAAKCLDGIKTAIEELTELRKAQSLDTEAVRTALEKIAGLSGEFYQLIPHRESANGPIAPFNSLEEVCYCAVYQTLYRMFVRRSSKRVICYSPSTISSLVPRL
jgi:hypothetical protein